MRNTGWALGAEAVRLLTSVGTFVIVTHLLSPSEYGVYVGTLGLLWIVLPFASFGAGYLLLMQVAAGGVAIGDAVARANGLVITGGIVAAAALVTTRQVVLPQSPALVLALLALAELVCGGMHEAAVFASQASERLRISLLLRLTQGVSRFAAAIGLLIFNPTADLTDWAWLHLASAALAAALAQLFFRTSRGSWILVSRPHFADVRAGLPFSIGFGADKLRDSAGGMLLLRIGSSTDAGIFGAANRLISLAVMPVRALIASSNARIFSAGSRSIGAAMSVARRVTLFASAYAILVGIGIAVTAPIVVSVLPDDYAPAGDALRLLCALPVVMSFEAFVATAITAAGYQRVRVASTLLSTALNIALNIALIPHHGWRGAIVAALAYSIMNAIILWSALLVLAHRERRRHAHGPITHTEARP
jgi:O-antigen/teichoic acid export membrane protein